MGNCGSSLDDLDSEHGSLLTALAIHFRFQCDEQKIGNNKQVDNWLKQCRGSGELLSAVNLLTLSLSPQHLDTLLSSLRINASGIIRGVRIAWQANYVLPLCNHLRSANNGTIQSMTLSSADGDIAPVLDALNCRRDILSLNLVDLKISGQDTRHIQACVRLLSTHSSLAVLSLSAVQHETDKLVHVSAHIAPILSAALSSNSLTELQLNSCDLDIEAARVIQHGLATTHRLKRLSIDGNLLLGMAGFTAIARGVRHNTTLTSLSVRNCNGRGEGVDAVSAGALNHASLTELDLGGNHADDEGALSVAYLISHTSTLKTLHLDNNDIGNGGMSIAKGLKMNASLTSLDLSGNHFNPRFPTILAGSLGTHLALQTLSLTNCCLDFGVNFKAGIEQNHSLLSIEIEEGNFFDDGTLSEIRGFCVRNRQERRSSAIASRRPSQAVTQQPMFIV
eukprot:TRINITY_DN6068_c0_g1_i1.p1 TRINITY_DN6068_c0_g1~~TRINITY_DN6068_c0_g1_i1.p1  ORF type:complete len:450 (+),score=43.89 TRINITY_DN6068_c0_g1_i1:83-1432(+)